MIIGKPALALPIPVIAVAGLLGSATAAPLQQVQYPGSGSGDPGLSDLVIEMHRLQQEVRQLRGELEVQQHRLDSLERQQQEQYLDLDNRLGGGSGVAPAAATATKEGTAAIPPSAPAAAPAAPPAPSPGGSRELPAAETPGSGRPPPVAPGPAAGAQVPPAGEEAAYQQAFALLQQGLYEQARGGFEALLARFPGGSYADNARYWLGESYYVEKDYTKALGEFSRMISDYPQSPKVPGALLKIGYIYEAQQDSTKARGALEELAEKYPSTTEARLAKSRLDRMSK